MNLVLSAIREAILDQTDYTDEDIIIITHKSGSCDLQIRTDYNHSLFVRMGYKKITLYNGVEFDIISPADPNMIETVITYVRNTRY